MALEPEWEARFEPSSYGFRPGRRCHDAIKQIKLNLQRRPKYVLDADISKCFDSINHGALLKRLGLKGVLHYQIKSWLKAGILDNFEYSEIETGTPQGGVISPLLANIALHGMENAVNQHILNITIRNKRGISIGKRDKLRSLSLIRYADDFIIMHEEKFVVLECQTLLKEYLSLMGLELKPSKTRLAHTLIDGLSEDNKAGFDFLGFHIQQYNSIYGSALENNVPLGFKTLITPSKKSCNKHQLGIKTLITKSSSSQLALISRLNPVILGWSRYFCISDGLRIFSKQDFLTYLKLRRWSKRQKGSISSASKYWNTVGKRKWVFKPISSSIQLASHTSIPCSVNNYVKVKGISSPFDGQHLYWAQRLKQSPILSPSTVKLLANQKGKCAYCAMYLQDSDVLEIDHIIPKSSGGKDVYNNLRLLHRHCHDTIHSIQ